MTDITLLPGLDHIANFLNALDTEGMAAKDVRTAIYTECLQPSKTFATTAALQEQHDLACAAQQASNTAAVELFDKAAALEAKLADLEERFETVSGLVNCGCSYDNPDDICLGHLKIIQRKTAALEAENAELKTALAEADHKNDTMFYEWNQAEARVEELEGAVAVFADNLESANDTNAAFALNQRICCTGQDCGCMGSSVGQYLAYYLRHAALRKGQP